MWICLCTRISPTTEPGAELQPRSLHDSQHCARDCRQPCRWPATAGLHREPHYFDALLNMFRHWHASKVFHMSVAHRARARVAGLRMRLKRRVSACIAGHDTDLRPRAHPISLATDTSIHDLPASCHEGKFTDLALPTVPMERKNNTLPRPSRFDRAEAWLGDVALVAFWQHCQRHPLVKR